ncbi:MAG: hypothetical protein Q8927_18350 [Bacteroidota bacterium]|nr:hypothetical protein [Bacteroidota bacterium]MDP4218165.1 hypothetical protein [Bacteroidota bacterium]MDP4255771.1 hypothetical protein [Bacteroidota bacterium]
MKNTVPTLLISIFYIFLNGCTNSQAGLGAPSTTLPAPARAKTTQELREELASQEAADPTLQLVASGTIEENRVLIQKPDFFHHSVYQTDGYIIHGVIRNKATIARFKDANVRINFYTETQTDLGGQNYIVYKYFNPNSEAAFDIKVYPPAVMRNFSIQVTAAKAL